MPVPRRLVWASVSLLLLGLPAGGAVNDPYHHVEEARGLVLQELALPLSPARAEALIDSLGSESASPSIRAYDQAVSELRRMRQRVPSDRFERRGMWLRPYRSDLSHAHLLEVLDHAVDRGLTDLYIEDFWGGKLAEPSPLQLFPARYPGYALLRAYAREAHRRGIKVHAWLHTLDFGPTYAAAHPDLLVYDGWGKTSGSTEKGSSTVDPGLGANRAVLKALVAELSDSGHVDGIILDYLRYPVRLTPEGEVDERPDPRNFWGYNPRTHAEFFSSHPELDTPAWHAYLAPVASDSATASAMLPAAPAPKALTIWKDWLSDRVAGLVSELRPAIKPGVALSSAFFPNYYFHVHDNRLQESNRWLSLFEEVHPMCYSYYLDPNPGPYGTYTISRELEIMEAGLAQMPTGSLRPSLLPALSEDPPRTPMWAPFHHRIFREQVSWLRGRMQEGQFPSVQGLSFFSYGWIFGPSEARRMADDSRPAPVGAETASQTTLK